MHHKMESLSIIQQDRNSKFESVFCHKSFFIILHSVSLLQATRLSTSFSSLLYKEGYTTLKAKNQANTAMITIKTHLI